MEQTTPLLTLDNDGEDYWCNRRTWLCARFIQQHWVRVPRLISLVATDTDPDDDDALMVRLSLDDLNNIEWNAPGFPCRPPTFPKWRSPQVRRTIYRSCYLPIDTRAKKFLCADEPRAVVWVTLYEHKEQS